MRAGTKVIGFPGRSAAAALIRTAGVHVSEIEPAPGIRRSGGRRRRVVGERLPEGVGMSLNVSSDVRTPGSPSLPDGGISMVRAVQLAREHAGESCQLVMASGGRAGCVYTTPTGARTAGLAPDRLVWVVTFRGGHLPNPSPALRSPLPCYSPRTGTLTVVLDYFTGAFLEASPRVERRLPAAYVLAGRTTARRSFERG